MEIEKLREIRRRCDAATIGPWVVEQGDYSGSNWLVGSLLVGFDDKTQKDYVVHITTDSIHASEYESDGALADAEFIAHARTDIPELVSEVVRLMLVIEKLTEVRKEGSQS